MLSSQLGEQAKGVAITKKGSQEHAIRVTGKTTIAELRFWVLKATGNARAEIRLLPLEEAPEAMQETP